MSLRDRIPVEPLEPERWGHLEQRVVAHAGEALATPARRRWWPMLIAVGGAGAVVLAAVALHTSAPARPAAPLVVTANATGAHVELGDAVIDATPGTRFEVTRPDGGVRIALASGSVSLEVAPRRDRPPLWVVAGEVSVRVVGTAFTVTRDPDVTVTVAHGVVEVDRGGPAVAVGAGQRWSALDGLVAAVSLAPDPVAPGALATAADRLDDHPTSDPLALTDAPEVALGSRRAAAPPVGTPPRLAPGANTRASHPVTPRATTAVVKPPTDLRADIAAQSIPPARAIAATTPVETLAAYQRQLLTSRGDAASSALWGLARAQWSQGKSADAVKSLDGYLRRFTSGNEADAVRWLRLRLLCARAFDDTCRAAAHTYATSAADGPRRDLAVRTTQTR